MLPKQNYPSKSGLKMPASLTFFFFFLSQLGGPAFGLDYSRDERAQGWVPVVTLAQFESRPALGDSALPTGTALDFLASNFPLSPATLEETALAPAVLESGTGYWVQAAANEEERSEKKKMWENIQRQQKELQTRFHHQKQAVRSQINASMEAARSANSNDLKQLLPPPEFKNNSNSNQVRPTDPASATAPSPSQGDQAAESQAAASQENPEPISLDLDPNQTQQTITQLETELKQKLYEVAGLAAVINSPESVNQFSKPVEQVFLYSVVAAINVIRKQGAERGKGLLNDLALPTEQFFKVIGDMLDSTRNFLLTAVPQAFTGLRARVDKAYEWAKGLATDIFQRTFSSYAYPGAPPTFEGVKLRAVPNCSAVGSPECQKRLNDYFYWMTGIFSPDSKPDQTPPSNSSPGFQILASEFFNLGYSDYLELTLANAMLKMGSLFADYTRKVTEAAEIVRKISALRALVSFYSGDLTQMYLLDFLLNGRGKVTPFDADVLSAALAQNYLIAARQMKALVWGTSLVPYDDIPAVQVTEAEKALAKLFWTNPVLEASATVVNALSASAPFADALASMIGDIDAVRSGSAPFGIRVGTETSESRDSLNLNLSKQFPANVANAINQGIVNFESVTHTVQPVHQVVFELKTKNSDDSGSGTEAEYSFKEVLLYGDPDAQQYIQIGPFADTLFVEGFKAPFLGFEIDSPWYAFTKLDFPLSPTAKPFASTIGGGGSRKIDVSGQPGSVNVDFKAGVVATLDKGISALIEATIKAGPLLFVHKTTLTPSELKIPGAETATGEGIKKLLEKMVLDAIPVKAVQEILTHNPQIKKAVQSIYELISFGAIPLIP